MKLISVALFTLLLFLPTAVFPAAQNPPSQADQKLEIVLYLQKVDARKVLSIICNVAGLELEMPQDIKETVTVNLEMPTLREALEATVQPVGLTYTIEGSSVRIMRR